MTLNRKITGLATAAAAAFASVAGVAAGSGARSYANCTALNADYPHGVGRTNARDRVRGSTTPVTNFKRSNALYTHNDGDQGSRRYPGERDLDRDNDGVACEKL